MRYPSSALRSWLSRALSPRSAVVDRPARSTADAVSPTALSRGPATGANSWQYDARDVQKVGLDMVERDAVWMRERREAPQSRATSTTRRLRQPSSDISRARIEAMWKSTKCTALRWSGTTSTGGPPTPPQAARKPPSARIVKRWRRKGSGQDEAVRAAAVAKIGIGFQDLRLRGKRCVKRDPGIDLHEFVRSKASHGVIHEHRVVFEVRSTTSPGWRSRLT